ncbi:hypothetical protein ACU635_17570 [[Actinomadura] parvosata]|uniref:hypothetical protein n=1 Tax=[Actinomadura] parvosata TaxID=1955412 RepID=UPI00406CAC7F
MSGVPARAAVVDRDTQERVLEWQAEGLAYLVFSEADPTWTQIGPDSSERLTRHERADLPSAGSAGTRVGG